MTPLQIRDALLDRLRELDVSQDVVVGLVVVSEYTQHVAFQGRSKNNNIAELPTLPVICATVQLSEHVRKHIVEQ
jgi:hypothetical protein